MDFARNPQNLINKVVVTSTRRFRSYEASICDRYRMSMERRASTQSCLSSPVEHQNSMLGGTGCVLPPYRTSHSISHVNDCWMRHLLPQQSLFHIHFPLIIDYTAVVVAVSQPHS
jgi:hypothetical protein